MQDHVDVDTAVSWSIRAQAPFRLLELTLAAGPVLTARVVPGDGDVNQSLKEVALGFGCIAPFVLELLVRLEVRLRADQLDTALESHNAIIRVHPRDRRRL